MNRAIIGAKLRTLRGKTPRADVAKACGISVSAIQMYETGERIPSDDVKISLAKFFGDTVGSLFFDENDH